MSIVLVSVLAFIGYLIGTLAYSVRIVGTRTGRIAVSFSLFGVLALVSRTANTFQGPILAKQVEQYINGGVPAAVSPGHCLRNYCSCRLPV